MHRVLQLPHGELKYLLKISKKSKSIRLQISAEQGCVVTIPVHTDSVLAEKFLQDKASWIEKKLKYLQEMQSVPRLLPQNLSRRDYLKHKEPARLFVESRLQYFNQVYQQKWGKVSIRDTQTRWGSCSKKRNLNFSYKLVLLPNALSDYVIVHELCHLIAFNHSKKFWDLVAITIPNWQQLRKQLRQC